jgi:predicted O-linked N-acetylglucosamine transferase (SPINDLY family)
MGETFASRVAGSLLHAVGIPELITTSFADYEALAFKLATDPAALGQLRVKLAANRKTAPLFDADRTRRHIESAYIQMWDRHQSGQSAESFSVEPFSGELSNG